MIVNLKNVGDVNSLDELLGRKKLIMNGFVKTVLNISLFVKKIWH